MRLIKTQIRKQTQKTRNYMKHVVIAISLLEMMVRLRNQSLIEALMQPKTFLIR